MEKSRRLENILRSQDQGSKIIIFCSTKKMCDQLARNLSRQFGAAAIHGDKSQADRDHVLSQFRTGRSPVLVATDVAARGLDVKDIRLLSTFVLLCFCFLSFEAIMLMWELVLDTLGYNYMLSYDSVYQVSSKVSVSFGNDRKFYAGWLSITTFLQEWRIMFIGLEELGELEPLV